MPSQYQCNHCAKHFSARSQLNRHLKVHDTSHWFACTHCPYQSSQKSNLHTHIRAKHNGEKPYSCSLCAFKFGDRSALNRHAKTKHRKKLDEELARGCTLSVQGNVTETPPSPFQRVTDPDAIPRARPVSNGTATPISLGTEPFPHSVRERTSQSVYLSADARYQPDVTLPCMAQRPPTSTLTYLPAASYVIGRQALPMSRSPSPNEGTASIWALSDPTLGADFSSSNETVPATGLLYPYNLDSRMDQQLQTNPICSTSLISTPIQSISVSHAYPSQLTPIPSPPENPSVSNYHLFTDHSPVPDDGWAINVPHANVKRQSSSISISAGLANTAAWTPCLAEPLPVSRYEGLGLHHEITLPDIAADHRIDLEPIMDNRNSQGKIGHASNYTADMDSAQRSADVNNSTMVSSFDFSASDTFEQFWNGFLEAGGLDDSDRNSARLCAAHDLLTIPLTTDSELDNSSTD